MYITPGWTRSVIFALKTVSGANVITTDNSDWATNCPEFKVTAVQVTKVTQPSDWQEKYQKFSEKQIDLVKKNEEKVN